LGVEFVLNRLQEKCEVTDLSSEVGEVRFQLRIGYVALGVEVEPAVALLVLAGEPLAQVGAALLEVGAGTAASHLLAHALKDRSGVTKELPHVGPDGLLEPLGADVGGVPARGSAKA
jgi:hypothetical protein